MTVPGDGGKPAYGYGPNPGPPAGGYPYPPSGPAPGWAGPMPPDKNIGWAIAALLLFWPLSIPAFIASLKVSDLWFTGRYQEALQASADAKKWGVAGVVVGGCLIVLGLGLYVVAFLFALGTAGTFG